MEGVRTTTAVDREGNTWSLIFSLPSVECTTPDVCVQFAGSNRNQGASCACARPLCHFCQTPVVYGWRSYRWTGELNTYHACPWCVVLDRH